MCLRVGLGRPPGLARVSGSDLGQACTYGGGRGKKPKREQQKCIMPLEDLKLTHCHVLCILLAKANDKESPVSKHGETESTS